MQTLQQLSAQPDSIPASIAWYLADLGEARGQQELSTRQAPQKLRVLREHAFVESAISSNRIEGIEVDHKRVGSIVFGQSLLRDRDEEEIRGYRDALNLIHEQADRHAISEETIRNLHKLTRGQIWDAGQSHNLQKLRPDRPDLHHFLLAAKHPRPRRGNQSLRLSGQTNHQRGFARSCRQSGS